MTAKLSKTFLFLKKVQSSIKLGEEQITWGVDLWNRAFKGSTSARSGVIRIPAVGTGADGPAPFQKFWDVHCPPYLLRDPKVCQCLAMASSQCVLWKIHFSLSK